MSVVEPAVVPYNNVFVPLSFYSLLPIDTKFALIFAKIMIIIIIIIIIIITLNTIRIPKKCSKLVN